MVDAVETMVTINNEWYQSIPKTTVLTGEQQGYFLFALLALFVIGFGIYFYWQDKQEQSE